MNRAEIRIRFLPLPHGPSRWRSFVLSFLVQVPVLASVAAFAGSEWAVSQRLGKQLRRGRTQVAWVQPAPAEPPVEVSTPPSLRVPVEVPTVPKITAPVLTLPQSQSAIKAPPLVASLEPYRPIPIDRQPEPRLQAPPVKTGVFGGSHAVPTLPPAPAQKVQTGGFGDSNGIEHSGPGGNGKLVVASLGNFDLPSGAGHGNGSGGAQGLRGVVPSAGFGDRTAADQRAVAQPSRVQATNFTPVVEAAKPVKKDEGPADVPVAILEKPSPIYTQEARELHLEGEVLLEVVFTANGRVRIVRLLRGLGHGLDEAAARAAEKIRFAPAQRNQRAIDTTATLHVVFQLT